MRIGLRLVRKKNKHGTHLTVAHFRKVCLAVVSLGLLTIVGFFTVVVEGLASKTNVQRHRAEI